MILVDTSVWVDFFRGARRAAGLAPLLEDNQVLVHPWIVGELSLGSLGPERRRILDDLGRIPAAPVLSQPEMLHLVEVRSLAGSGIGWVDAQILGSALLAGGRVWTHDRRLATAARGLGLVFGESDADGMRGKRGT